jgi:hypothetical protein
MYTTYHYKHYSNIDNAIVTYAVHSESNLDMVRQFISIVTVAHNIVSADNDNAIVFN